MKHWAQLAELCKKINHLMYEDKDIASANHYREPLRQLLLSLPDNDFMAIIRQEGEALYCELSGNYVNAIKYRKKEIQLMERLHKSVRKSIAAKEYDQSMGESILIDRDQNVLEKRRVILKDLEMKNLPSLSSSRRSITRTILLLLAISTSLALGLTTLMFFLNRM